MALEHKMTDVNNRLKAKKFSSEVMHEGRGKSFFSKFTSTKGDNVIWVRDDLKAAGDGVIYPFIRSLEGAGVTGKTRLIGNEETLQQHEIYMDCGVLRHAVASYAQDQAWIPWDLDKEAREALITWYADKLDQLLMKALTTNNTNVLYAPNASGAWATAESQLTSGHKLTVDVLSGLKAVLDSSYKIFQHVKVSEFGNKKYAIGLFHPDVINDLRKDPDWKTIQKDAAERGTTNPLFSGAEGYVHGTVCWSYDKVPVTLTGAGGIPVYHNVILGEKSAIHAVKEKMKPISQDDDYGEVKGKGVRSIEGLNKVTIENRENSKRTDFGVIKFVTAGSPAPATFKLFNI